MAYKVSFGSYQHSGSLQATVDITGSTTVSGAVGNFGTLTVSSFSPANISSTNITASSNMSASTANFGTLTVGTFSPANLTIAGNLIVSGNTQIGDAGTDTVSFTSKVNSNILPTGTVDLGSVTNLWTNIYASSISASSTLQAGGDLTVAGASVFNGNVTLGNASADIISVGGLFTSSLSPRVSGEVTIGSPSNLWLGISAQEISASIRVRAGTSMTAQTLTASVGATLGAAVVTSLSSSGNVIVGGDLTVQGTTTTVNSTTLEIKDKNIVIASGSTTSLLANGSGLTLGSTGYEFNFQSSSAGTSTDFWQVSGSTGLTDFKAKTVFATVDGHVTQQVTNLGDASVTLSVGINYSQADFTAPRTWTLPASPSVGQSVKVKAPHNCDVTNTLTVSAGAKAIDFTGNTTVVLASPDAALELVYVDSANNLWKIF